MPKGMKIIATLSVGLKEKVMVVEINHEQYILGVTANQINLLEKLTTPMTASSVPPADLSASLVNLFKKKS